MIYYSTWLVNSASHMLGYRTYPTADRSTKCRWVAMISRWGEGWHKNHHAFPFSARHGLRWYEIDLTWWHVKTLAFLATCRSSHLSTASRCSDCAKSRTAARVRKEEGGALIIWTQLGARITPGGHVFRLCRPRRAPQGHHPVPLQMGLEDVRRDNPRHRCGLFYFGETGPLRGGQGNKTLRPLITVIPKQWFGGRCTEN